ncbi:MAG: Gram-negative bacterial tonB protein [Fluviicola sp.]|jgi:TonB family protein|uniref:energy transducer TonB n=1 Tax=Fluviicola sp. TaxID=1917219 RepID=UPI00261FA2DA|nr:energy transducer TonB [Fluviicola sp.]MDF3027901.1 Gram-negative bacterial tonB protein [Fluviicola sp.]
MRIAFILLFIPFTAFLQKTGKLVLSGGDPDYYGYDKTEFAVYYNEQILGNFDKEGFFEYSSEQKGPLTIKHPDFLPLHVEDLNISKKNSAQSVFITITPEAEQIILDKFKAEQSITCTGSDKKDIDVFALDSVPEFPGGNNALSRFLSDHAIYPQAAVERGIVGKVYIQFIVEADGSITCIKVVKGVDYLLDREAFRCVKKMPKFKPAYRKGVPAPCTFSLPITFNLN